MGINSRTHFVTIYKTRSAFYTWKNRIQTFLNGINSQKTQTLLEFDVLILLFLLWAITPSALSYHHHHHRRRRHRADSTDFPDYFWSLVPMLWPCLGPKIKTQERNWVKQIYQQRTVIQHIQMRGLLGRLFGPIVKAVCWNIAFCLRAVPAAICSCESSCVCG